MTCITAADNTVYCDGVYSGICSREKMLLDFDGTVQLTDDACVVANGRCAECNHPMTAVLYISQ